MRVDSRGTRPEDRAWAAHDRAQRDYFRSLSLREKLQAVEGMADVVRRFEEIRAAGGFKAADQASSQPAPPAPQE